MVVSVIETYPLLRRDLEPPREWKRKSAHVSTRALKGVVDVRGNERRTAAAEELVDIHIDARSGLVVEIESEAAGPERAEAVDAAREPQVFERSRSLHVEDHVLTAAIDVERRIGAVEAVVVSSGAVVARQIVSLDPGIENGIA